MSEEKTIHFTVPRPLWEEFYRRFNRRGEQKTLFIGMMNLAIELVDKKDCFIEQMREEILRRGDEE